MMCLYLWIVYMYTRGQHRTAVFQLPLLQPLPMQVWRTSSYKLPQGCWTCTRGICYSDPNEDSLPVTPHHPWQHHQPFLLVGTLLDSPVQWDKLNPAPASPPQYTVCSFLQRHNTSVNGWCVKKFMLYWNVTSLSITITCVFYCACVKQLFIYLCIIIAFISYSNVLRFV